MYAEPYFVDNLPELAMMVEIADYYCALPMLSKSLPIALCERYLKIHKSTKEYLQIACKLRQEDLFKECVTILAGNWGSEAMNLIDELDWNLRTIVMAARGRIALKMTEAVQSLTNTGYDENLTIFLADTARGQCMAEYYRDVIHKLNMNDINDRINCHTRSKVTNMLMPLMENNLRFTRVDGENRFERYFLCATVSPRELPWTYERDW